MVETIAKLFARNREFHRSARFHRDRLHRTLSVAFPLLAVTVAACGEDPNQPDVTTENIRVSQYLTPDAAAHLTSDGTFPLQREIDWPYPQISAIRAKELAETLRVHLLQIATTLQKEHGAGIDFNKLKACGSVYYAEPSLPPLPSEVSLAIRRAYGPYWLVNLCGASGKPEVNVGVAALSTDLRIENGTIVYPPIGGNWFTIVGIPKSRPEGFPPRAEAAVARLAGATGLRISAFPRLIIPPGKAPWLAYWRVEISSPARVARLGANTFGSAFTLLTNSAESSIPRFWVQGDTTVLYQYHWSLPPATYGQSPTWFSGVARARPGLSVNLNEVRILP